MSKKYCGSVASITGGIASVRPSSAEEKRLGMSQGWREQ